MQAKRRYAYIVLGSVALFLVFWMCRSDPKASEHAEQWDYFPVSFITTEDLAVYIASDLRSSTQNEKQPPKHCTFVDCFDFSRCKGSFKVHIYPSFNSSNERKISERYVKILSVIEDSPYYTSDPNEACLFVLGLDSLDRDPLSTDYVKNFPQKLKELPADIWRNGTNHLLFNLYSGSWPDYRETDLGFSTGKAMLAKASFSLRHFRRDFDISLPLFHSVLPIKGASELVKSSLHFPPNERFVVSFKGKRYVYGKGSDTRNSVYHLHNNKSMIFLTTCKHGKDWKEMQDERCEVDNVEYDKWDYRMLLNNSTFCLVPRGRRLGSFRFLETLQAGCIPIILSNEWVLPFSEIIDWMSFVVIADERLLLQVPDLARSIPSDRVFQLKQGTQQLYTMYFSSVQNIVLTTLEIIRDRIDRWKSRDRYAWNLSPVSAIYQSPDFSLAKGDFPFYSNSDKDITITALVYTGRISSSLTKLVVALNRSQYVRKIVVLWLDQEKPLPQHYAEQLGKAVSDLEVLDARNMGDSSRFYASVSTDAVFSVDEGTALSTDEVDFAVEVWRSFPDQLIGYFAEKCYWDAERHQWQFSSKLTNDYNLLFNTAVIYHRYYNYAYHRLLASSFHVALEQYPHCHGILLNMLVARISGKPPIKLSARMAIQERSSDILLLQQKALCLNTFSSMFGQNPLRTSLTRFDPLLYKDSISNFRKKFRDMELN